MKSIKVCRVQLTIKFSLKKSVSIVCNQEGICEAIIDQKGAKTKLTIENKVKEDIFKFVRSNISVKYLEKHLEKSIQLDFKRGCLILRKENMNGGGCRFSKTKNIKKNETSQVQVNKVSEQFKLDQTFIEQYNKCVDNCQHNENNIKKIIDRKYLQENLRDEMVKIAENLLKNVNSLNQDNYKRSEQQILQDLKKKKENQEYKNFIEEIEEKIQHDFIGKYMKFDSNDIQTIFNQLIEKKNTQLQLNTEIQDLLYSSGEQIQNFLIQRKDKFDPSKNESFIYYKPYLISILQQQIDCLISLQAVKRKQNQYLKNIMDILDSLQQVYQKNQSIYPVLDLILYVEILQGINLIDEIKNRDAYTILKDFQKIFVSVIKIAVNAYTVNLGSIPAIILEIKDNLSEFIKSAQSFYEQIKKPKSEIDSIQKVEKSLINSSQNFFIQLVNIWTYQAEEFKDKDRIFHRRFGDVSEKSSQIEWLEIIFYLELIQKGLGGITNESTNNQQPSNQNQIIKKKDKTLLLCLLLKLDNILQILFQQLHHKALQKVYIDSNIENRLQNGLLDIYKLTEFEQNYNTSIELGCSDLKNNQIVFLAYSILITLWKILYHYENEQPQMEQIRTHLLERITYGNIFQNSENIDIIFKFQDNDFINLVSKNQHDKEYYYKIFTKFNKNKKDKQEFEKQFELGEKKKKVLWELDIEKRKELGIQEKDDVLLEVKDYYIDQSLKYISGNKHIISPYEYQQNKYQEEDNNEEYIIQNAIKFVTEVFLKQKQCKILAVLADGGSGKSMFLKKVQLDLIEKYDTLRCPPILLKLNSMNSKKPSIKDMLRSDDQMSSKSIKELKKSNNTKLILLDGFDEFSGDYFNIYEKLKLSKWKNILVILTSRKEKIRVNKMESYLSIQSSSNVDDSYCICDLLKFNSPNIIQYYQSYFKKLRPDKSVNANLTQELIQQFEEFLQNKEIEELLQLPINLYLLTRFAGALTNDEINNNAIKSLKISDQSSLQQIFFEYQFQREAQSFIERSGKAKNRLMNSQLALTMIKNCYYEYFQEIAMQMFCQKSKQMEFLKVSSKQIIIQIDPELKIILNDIQLEQKLQQSIKTYLNSQIINRVEQQQKRDEEFIEFRHKSLFESFAAKAMIYDFQRCRNKDQISKIQIKENDTNKWAIKDMSLGDLQMFKVNNCVIMEAGHNNSEGQVLVQLNKLIQREYETNKEIIQDIIEYILKTRTHGDVLDVGSSNLISALLFSNFYKEKLDFSGCSFSSAYLRNCKLSHIKFENSNLSKAFLKGCDLNIEKANVSNAYFNDIKLRSVIKVEQNVSCLAFSFNGKTLALGDSSGAVTLYSVEQDRYILKDFSWNSGKPDVQLKVLFSNDESQLAIQCDKDIHVYSFCDLSSITVQKNGVDNFTFFEDGKLAVVNRNQIVLYSRAQEGYTELSQIPLASSIRIEVLQQRLFQIQDQTTIRIYKNINTEYLSQESYLSLNIQINFSKDRTIQRLRMSQNGNVVAVELRFQNDDPSEIQLYRLNENIFKYWQNVCDIKKLSDFVLNPEGTELTIELQDSILTTWQLNQIGMFELYSVLDGNSEFLLMNPDGLRLLIWSKQHFIKEQNQMSIVESLTPPKFIPKPCFPFEVFQFQLQPDSKLIALICFQGLFVYSINHHSYLEISINDGSKDYSPVWTQDSQYLILSNGKNIQIYKVLSRQDGYYELQKMSDLQSQSNIYQVDPSFFAYIDSNSILSFYYFSSSTIEQKEYFGNFKPDEFCIAQDYNKQNEFIINGNQSLTLWRLDEFQNRYVKLFDQESQNGEGNIKYINDLILMIVPSGIKIYRISNDTNSNTYSISIQIISNPAMLTFDNIFYENGVFYGLSDETFCELWINKNNLLIEKNSHLLLEFKKYRIQSFNCSSNKAKAIAFHQRYYEFIIYNNDFSKQQFTLPQWRQICS